MDLGPLELTQIEEKVLRVIIANASVLAKTIIDQVGHDKKVVYDVLDKLHRKALITSDHLYVPRDSIANTTSK